MRRVIALGSLLCLAAFLTGGNAAVSSRPRCEDVLPEVEEWVREHQADNQGARDRMMERLDGLLAVYGAAPSRCSSSLWLNRVLLSQISEQRDDVVRLVTAYLERPVADREPVGVSRMHSARATTLAEMGRVVEARQDYLAAAALVSHLPAGAAALTLRDFASSALTHRDWRGAEEALRRARRILLDSMASDPEGMRRRLGRLGFDEAYALRVRLEDARDPARRRLLARRLLATATVAVAILGEADAPGQSRSAYDRGLRALTMSNMGYAAGVLGEHARAAETMERAIALVDREVRDLMPMAASEIWYFRSETERMRGSIDAATRAALTSRDESIAMEDPASETDAVVLLARLAEQTGRFPEAERWYREAAAYREVEWERARLQDWSAALFANSQDTYSGLARVLIAQGRVEEGFVVLDGARARALRAMRSNVSRRARLEPTAQVHIDSLIEAVRSRRVALLDHAAGSPGAVRTERQISLLQQEIDREMGAAPERQSPVSLAELQPVLREQGRTLVTYLVGDENTIALVVTADTLAARTLQTTGADVIRLMGEAGGPWNDSGADPAVRLGPLHELHERLIRPLRDVVPSSGGLVIIPEGPLADLPFGVLVEESARDYATARFLVRRQPISTDLAAALIVEDAARPGTTLPVDLVAFGRGEFEQTSVSGQGRGGPVLANLPHATREVQQISNRVWNRETAVDGKATEARFGREAIRARIVHIASHAEVNPVSPLYSRVHLWDDPEAGDDGVVHLFELQDLRLSADLVVLSGCSTATGQSHAGEGTVGLQYGVRAAGARAALATLWPVDDQATAEIIDAFYEGIVAGLPKDHALQQAQVAYLDRHTGVDASPYYWASAVLSGSPAPVPLQTRSSAWGWALGIATALTGIGGLAWHSRRRPANV
ncbi:MAG TPA: CHAT domain-containing protein [Rubricoccaceae bacterium]|jgi:CHAT domain-containing protein